MGRQFGVNACVQCSWLVPCSEITSLVALARLLQIIDILRSLRGESGAEGQERTEMGAVEPRKHRPTVICAVYEEKNLLRRTESMKECSSGDCVEPEAMYEGGRRLRESRVVPRGERRTVVMSCGGLTYTRASQRRVEHFPHGQGDRPINVRVRPDALRPALFRRPMTCAGTLAAVRP